MDTEKKQKGLQVLNKPLVLQKGSLMKLRLQLSSLTVEVIEPNYPHCIVALHENGVTNYEVIMSVSIKNLWMPIKDVIKALQANPDQIDLKNPNFSKFNRWQKK